MRARVRYVLGCTLGVTLVAWFILASLGDWDRFHEKMKRFFGADYLFRDFWLEVHSERDCSRDAALDRVS